MVASDFVETCLQKDIDGSLSHQFVCGHHISDINEVSKSYETRASLARLCAVAMTKYSNGTPDLFDI